MNLKILGENRIISMKKITLLTTVFLLSLFLSLTGQAQILKSVNLSNAGSLSMILTADELLTLTSLSITGTMDARDFKTLRDKMPLLSEIDLSNATVIAYSGNEGTYSIYRMNYSANTIPQNAFNNYNSTIGKTTLTSIKLPEKLTSIGYSSFAYCTGLTTITIPSTVSELGDYAFRNCTGLTSIYIQASFPILLNYYYTVFINVNTANCILHVPYKAKALYSSTQGWKIFSNIVENTSGFITNSSTLKTNYESRSISSIDISANVPWTISSDQPWVSVTPTSALDDKNLVITVAQNDSTTRRFANITVSSPGFSSIVIKVTQMGAPITLALKAGNLSKVLTAEQLKYTTDLIINDTLDVRDFKTMRDLMPELERIDMSNATIAAFTGTSGTYDFNTAYSANAVPPSAFYVNSFGNGKTSLISIKLPPTVNNIGYSAFQGCTGLTSIYLNTIYPIDFKDSGNPFYETNKASCTLYIPYETKSYYATATIWKDFENIVEANDGFLVSQRAVRFAASTISKTISVPVKANVGWATQSDSSWLVVTFNESSITLTAEANTTQNIRKTTIKVSASGFYSQTIDITQAAAPVNVVAGQLSSTLIATELSSVSEIALMGTIDARDFKTMRESMPNLADIDLSAISIVAYEGLSCGTFGGSKIVKYPANEIPEEIFYSSKKIKSIVLPQTVISIGKSAFASSSLTSVSFPNTVEYIATNAFSQCEGLISIVLPKSLKVIGAYAFNGCTNLSSNLRFSFNLKTIRSSAFNNCANLSGDLIIPSTLDSIGSEAFNSCYKITSVSINSSNTKIGDAAFSGCYSLTTVNLPADVLTIGNSVFRSCIRLESINLPSAIKSIGEKAFLNSGLSSISFPSTLTTIGASSFSLTKLSSIEIPPTLKDIGNAAFSNCTTLNSVQFPSTLKSIPDEMFSGCTGLTNIEFPQGLETIGSAAFSNCTGLENVDLPPLLTAISPSTFLVCTRLKTVTFPSSLTSIGYNAFISCTSLTTLNFPPLLKTIGYSAFSNCSGLISVTLPSVLLTLEGRVFQDCTSLLEVTIPSSVKSIGDYSFSNCKSLTSITIPSNVETLGEGGFYNCTGLKTIEIAVGLKSIGSKAFQFCRGLTSINIPSSVKTIGGYTFDSCSGLKTVTLNENLESIDYYCFASCTNLTSINLPNTLKNIGGYCFIQCASLKSIVIPPLITEIGGFSYCKNLTSVTLNSGLKSVSGFEGCGFSTILLPNSLVDIGSYAFSECGNLTSIAIPPNVKRINRAAFNNCVNLTSINIPASVNDIGSGAFGRCTGLTSIYSYMSTPVEMTFSGDGFYGIDKTKCILYVPLGTKAAYSRVQFWKDFSNIIEMPTALSTLDDELVNFYFDPISNSYKFIGIEGVFNISVYNLNGTTMLSKHIRTNESISMNNLASGMYIVRIVTENGIIEKKILKK